MKKKAAAARHGVVASLATKISLGASLVLCLALALSGYWMILQSYNDAMAQANAQALDRYQYVKFNVQSALITESKSWEYERVYPKVIRNAIADLGIQGYECAAFGRQGELVASSFEEGIPPTPPADLITNQSLRYKVVSLARHDYLVMYGTVEQSGQTSYLAVGLNISDRYESVQKMIDSYRRIFLVVLALELIVIFVFSRVLTRPIKKLTQYANRLTSGDYSKRVSIRSGDETETLGTSFNRMAGAIQEKIELLENAARQKEDFVSNFAHEIKTPMTSVIGYADMLYHKNLPREQVKAAAGYILEEGLRLESLAQKLMELTVLNRQDFVLTDYSAKELIMNISEALMPIFERKSVRFAMDLDDARVSVEYDLFKTMLLNIVDNSVKANASTVSIAGQLQNGMYRIAIRDDGEGIPDHEIPRITEAFYMVDKARARKQHGAGLGLSLVKRIAEVHHARLRIKSRLGIGTRVTVTLPAREVEYE